MDERENRRIVQRLWDAIDRADLEDAGELLHDDYVLEWPQSRERVIGRENFVAVNKNYPGRWRIEVQKLVASGDDVVTDVILSDGEHTERAVSFFQLSGGKILREVDYWPEPYDAPEWREKWVERM